MSKHAEKVSMPEIGRRETLLSSILDRLLGSPSLQNQEALKAVVARDLEALLNTRQAFCVDVDRRKLPIAIQEIYDKIKQGEIEDEERMHFERRRLPPKSRISESLLTYGMPDLSSWSLNSEDDRDYIRSSIKRAIEIFEPRLDRVSVTLEPLNRNETSTFSFNIKARLLVEPAPEDVMFDAMLQLDSSQRERKSEYGYYVVRGRE